MCGLLRRTGQVARVVRDVRAEGQLPGSAEGDREQEGGELERLVAQQRGYVVLHEHPDREVGEPDGSDNGCDASQGVDQAIADGGDDHRQHTEDNDADGTALDVENLVDRLPRQHSAGGGEPKVHQHHQHQGKTGAEDTELGAAGDHLRDAHPRALRRVQRHHRTAADVADQQPDDRPQGVRAEDDGQRPIDDRGDLHVGAEPERELVTWCSVALGIWDHVDRATLHLDSHRGAPWYGGQVSSDGPVRPAGRRRRGRAGTRPARAHLRLPPCNVLPRDLHTRWPRCLFRYPDRHGVGAMVATVAAPVALFAVPNQGPLVFGLGFAPVRIVATLFPGTRPWATAASAAAPAGSSTIPRWRAARLIAWVISSVSTSTMSSTRRLMRCRHLHRRPPAPSAPNIGTTSRGCASSHASANWPGRQFFSAASDLSASTGSRLVARFSAENRGLVTRKYPLAKVEFAVSAPV